MDHLPRISLGELLAAQRSVVPLHLRKKRPLLRGVLTVLLFLLAVGLLLSLRY